MALSLIRMTVEIRKGNRIIGYEKDRSNLLHIAGLNYIMTAAFAPEANPLKMIPKDWYFGLDRRKEVKESQVLVDAVAMEAQGEDYLRLKVTEEGGWLQTWEEVDDQKHFLIKGVREFLPTTDWGIVRNFFLTNASTGSNGLLLSSVPLLHAYPVDEGTSIKVSFDLDLRENKEKK